MCVAVEKRKEEKKTKGKQIKTKRQTDREQERRTQRQKSTEIRGREKKKGLLNAHSTKKPP
jgi:hypothetical protein